MAKRKKESKKTLKRSKGGQLPPGLDFISKLSPETKKGILIMFLIVLAGLSILSLFGIAGPLGKHWENWLKIIFGFQVYLIPIILLGLAYVLFKQEKYQPKIANFLGLILFMLSLSNLLHLFYEDPQEAARIGQGGGYLGFIFSYPLKALMGFWASLIVLFALWISSILVIFNTSLGNIVEKFKIIFERLQSYFLKITGKIFPEDKFEIKKIEEAENFKNSEELEESGESTGKENKILNQLDRLKLKRRKISSGEDFDKPEVIVDKNWKPFPLDLLDEQRDKPTSGDIKANAKIIHQTLRNFGIDVSMGEVRVGPTVTQYALKPATGVRLSQITSLHKDLALALAAHPIRIEAPIPGKSAVGVEVPNQAVAIVRLKEILASSEFSGRKSILTIALGRNVAGIPMAVDLDKMPHLLIAGATGSGKSVCINSVILSLLYQNSPNTLKLILVDPKKVELTNYAGIPHLLTPVITEVDKTVNALRWAVAEMERRFKLFSEALKRDIKTYNQQSSDPLPYIIVIIDELADLMSVAPNEVESAIVRLAQMARATGIHLILSTQRPSVNVITGLIKANITSRIAFAVASQIDSRTIIDTNGAEKLLGNGDMLYISSDISAPKRIQGAFVSEKEIERVVRYLKEGGEPEYNEKILERQASTDCQADFQDMDDELFEKAKEIVVQAGKGSASLLQRRLRVGYARAARLLDLLEEKGVVGPAEGSKPRDVLVENFGDQTDLEKTVEENNFSE